VVSVSLWWDEFFKQVCNLPECYRTLQHGGPFETLNCRLVQFHRASEDDSGDRGLCQFLQDSPGDFLTAQFKNYCAGPSLGRNCVQFREGFTQQDVSHGTVTPLDQLRAQSCARPLFAIHNPD